MSATPTPGPAPLVQLASFVVGQQAYAIDIMRVKEIINPLAITRVPGSPPFVEGIIELRGVILPVVDLRRRFELPLAPLSRAGKYVLVTLDDRIVALVVDAVGGFLRKPPSDIKAPPALVATSGQELRFFSGVCHHDGRIVMILDIDRILTSQERISLAHLGETGGGGRA
jgi:purine-binding chemotaxis protein CheW